MKKYFIPSYCIYSFYALHDMLNEVMIGQVLHNFALLFRPHAFPSEIYKFYNAEFRSNGLLEIDIHSLMSEKYLHLRNRHKLMARKFVPSP